MEELKQQIAHLIQKFGYEAVAEEVVSHSVHNDSGGGDHDNDADDGVGGIQDAPGDV